MSPTQPELKMGSYPYHYVLPITHDVGITHLYLLKGYPWAGNSHVPLRFRIQVRLREIIMKDYFSAAS